MMTTHYTFADATQDGQVTFFDPELKAGLRVTIQYQVLPDLTAAERAAQLAALFKRMDENPNKCQVTE